MLDKRYAIWTKHWPFLSRLELANRSLIFNNIPLQREAIMLAYYRGYTDAQVAGILDASLPATKTITGMPVTEGRQPRDALSSPCSQDHGEKATFVFEPTF